MRRFGPDSRRLVVLALLGSNARGEGLFVGGTPIPLGLAGDMIVATDLNGDSHPDAVVSHVVDGKVSILLWDATGQSFGAPETRAVGSSPSSFASGDLNGDGSRDVVVANSGSGTVSILANQGDGNFAAATEVVIPGSGSRMAQLADFNRDGRLDLAVDNEDSRDIAVLLGDGRGGLHPELSLPVGEKPHALSSGDFDGDGSVDLVAPIFEDATAKGFVHWFPGKPDGSFGTMTRTQVGTSNALRYSAAVDVDQDGQLDLAVVDLGGTLFLLRNRGSWSFNVEPSPCCFDLGTEIDMASWSSILQPVDFEGDGDLDLVVRVLRHEEAGFRIYENDGGGGFSPRAAVFVDREMGAPAMADFDQDGRMDALMTWTEPQLVLFRGEGSGRFPVKVSVSLNSLPRGLASFRDAAGASSIAVFGVSNTWILEPDPTALLQLIRSEDRAELSIQDLAAGDFDGRPGDELALLDLAHGSVVIVSSNPDPGAHPAVERPTGPLPTRLVSSDFDHDGLADLAVARWGAAAVTIFLAPGVDAPAPGRTFELEVASEPSALATADLDGDGNSDLLAGSDGIVRIFRGNGKGEFVAAGAIPMALDPAAMRAVDLDANGSMDLAIAGDTGCAVVWDAMKLDGGRLVAQATGIVALALDVGDLNGDGQLDIALAAQNMNAVAVILTNPDRMLAQPDMYGTGISPRSVVLRDMDQDGLLDAVTADFSSRGVSVLRGLRGPGEAFRRGDADLDSTLTLTDPIEVLGALFLGRDPLACPDSADANDDGRVSLTDAVFLLQHLFQGGPAPLGPGPESCGPDPTQDDLGPCHAACRTG